VETDANQPPLIVLPGGLGVADGGGEALHILGQGRRLLRVDYSGAADFEGLFKEVLGEAGGAARFDLIGFSIGGWFAQCIAARAPERVRKIVLAHSFLLEPKHRWRFSAALELWPVLPRSLVRAGVMRRARLALEPLRSARPGAHAQMVGTVSEALLRPAVLDGLLAQQALVRDSLAEPLGAVAAPMLIIDSGTDPLVNERARARLRNLYPGAEHVDFTAAGHVSALVAPEAFAAAVDRFLRA
jgi:pimeloyl-ACP methyl ester carboxylesterase